jgi:hypothetical protein
MTLTGLTLLNIGTAGMEEPVLAGTLIFGIVGIALAYLTLVRKEFETGIVLQVGMVLMFVMAILAFFWPSRPWPH